MASYYGAGTATDSFFVAHTIPNIFLTIIGVSLSLIFIPIFIEISANNNEKANMFASDIISKSFIIFLSLSLLGYILAPYIVKVMAPGFKENKFTLTVSLIRILLFTMPFISISSIISGLLQSMNRFFVPSLVNIPYNIVIILGIIFLSHRYGIPVIAWFTLLASIIQILIQLPFLKNRFHFHYNLLKIGDKDFQQFLILLIPVIIGTAFQQVNIIIDRILASSLQEGSISAISYADRLIGLGISVIPMSIAIAIYPKLSKASVEKDYVYLRNVLARSILFIVMILAPFTFGTIILRKELVFTVFSRGAFDSRGLTLTSYALAFYVLGSIPFSIREIFIRVLFSLKKGKIPMINGLIGAGINIILNLIFIKFLGIGGLGLATSITALISIWMLQRKIKEYIGPIINRESIMVIGKILVASILMAFVLIANKDPLPHSTTTINLIFSLILGTSIYFACISLLRIDEFSKIINGLKRVYKN